MSVPCNGCRLCCMNDIILLIPERGDELHQYEFEMAGEHPVMKRQANGHCIALGKDGCTIYDKRPIMCRKFDCAGMVQGLKKRDIPKLLKDGMVSKEIINRGRELLRRGYRPHKAEK